MNHFREKTASDTNYVTIRDGDKCSSPVGMIGGQQWVTLNQNVKKSCYFKDTIQHEFIHALGFDHVHSRPDRDQYVRIHYDNVEDGEDNINFERLPASWLTFNVEYDAKSYMHYSPKAFSINCHYTITSEVF